MRRGRIGGGATVDVWREPGDQVHAGLRHGDLEGVVQLPPESVHEDVLDELIVHVAPLPLGDGVRLYGGGPGLHRVELQGTALAESG